MKYMLMKNIVPFEPNSDNQIKQHFSQLLF